jgi:DNA-binding PadR family transcriptional regulator
MSLKFAILGLLSQAPMTGFDLIREFDVSRSVIWPAPQNEVYRVLRGLADEGLAASAAEGPRGARSYAITAAGRAELAAWLSAPSDYTLRYEPMLKAVFLRGSEPALRRARAEADAAFFRRQLAILQDARQQRGVEHARGDLLTMAMGFYGAMAAWAEAIESEA